MIRKLHLKSYKQLPLKLILVIPFLLEIFAAVGLVGYLSFKNGQRSVNDLASQLTNKTGDLVNQHLNAYLSIPHKITQINADAIKLGLLDMRDRKQTTQYLWKQMQAYDLTYIGYGLSTGEGGGAARYDGNTVSIDDWTAKAPKNLYTYATDNQGNRTEAINIVDYNSLNELWYTDPVKAGKPIWSRIYLWDFPDHPYIAASAGRPIYDANNQLLGVLVADIHVLKLSDFLHNLKVSQGGQVFILERNGMLIATSSENKPFKMVDGKIQRLKATESPDLLVQGITKQIEQKFGKLKKITANQDLQLEFAGEQHFIHLMPWQDEYGLDWLVVVVVPQSDFMAQIHANNRTTILLCLVALMVATLLGLYTCRWITRPILSLNQASVAIADGNLDQRVKASGIKELGHLAHTFNRMAQQLQESFTALEKSNDELELRVEQRTQELSHKNTQLQQTLAELHRTQAQMVQSEKMSALGQMVAGVAHEINNPVNFIHGNIAHIYEYTQNLFKLVEAYQEQYPNASGAIQDLLDETEFEFISEDLAKILRSMKIGTERIREIVLSLRNFSRLDEAEFKAVDIHEGINNTLVILQHRLKARSDRPEIEVIKNYGKLPLLECYAGQLNQVLMNIFSNAIDALEEANKLQSDQEIGAKANKIIIGTELTNNNQAKITIADNGCGITDKVKTKIFDPFFTTKPVGKGTGLGLSISYEIITEKHGGKLWCDSTPGQGTQFSIEIPLRQIARS
jgi:signal transduction histidine kinase